MKLKMVLLSLVAGAGLMALAEDPFVEFTAKQLVSIGYVPNANSRFEIDFEPSAKTVQTGQKRIVYAGGCQLYVNGSYNWGVSIQHPAVWESTGVAAKAERTRIIVDIKNHRVTVVDAAGVEHATTFKRDSATGYANLYLGGSSAERCSEMKVYSFKVYDDDVLVRDLVPALCNGSACLYDKVSKSVAMDAESSNSEKDLGSGGSIAEVPSPYVESKGLSGMNTRFIGGLDTRVEMDFALCDRKSQYRLFGAETADGGFNGLSMYLSSSLYFSAGDGTNYYQNSAMLSDLKRHTVVYDYVARTMTMRTGFEANTNGVISFTPAKIAAGMDCKYPLALFGSCGDETGATFGAAARRTKMRVYGFRIYKSDVLVHDYKPLVKGGVVGFRDLVDGAFISGEEADVFVAGGEVDRIADDGYVALPDENDGQSKGDCTATNKFILLDYKPGPKTRVELDYAFARNLESGTCALVTSYSGTVGDAPAERYYFCAMPGKYYLRMGSDAESPTITSLIGTATAKDVRRTAILDAKNKCAVLRTAGYTNVIKTVNETMTRTSSTGLRLGSNWDSPAGWVAPLRIYGCKVYEDDVLVRDYVPYVRGGVVGLKDTLSDDFGQATENGDMYLQLRAGGMIAGDASYRDAFVEFSGKQYVVTDYKPNARTHIVADIQCTCTLPTQQRFWYSGNEIANHLYLNGSRYWAFSYNKTAVWKSAGLAAGVERTLIDFDAKEKKLTFTINGVTTDKSSAWSSMPDYDYQTTSVLCIGGYTYAPNSNPCANMRLYGFKIYEGTTLLRDFVPYKNGETIGLLDLCSGNVFTVKSGGPDEPLKIGGQSAIMIATPVDTRNEVNKSATLTASVAGAVAYRWYRGDKLIEGEDGESLTVDWRKGKPYEETFTVRPVFSVFGEEVLGDPSQAVVKYERLGLVVVVQ